jgi:hypothetical protein
MRKLSQGGSPDPVDTSTELPIAAAAGFVLDAPEGSVLALNGIDSEGLRVVLDAIEPGERGRAQTMTAG